MGLINSFLKGLGFEGNPSTKPTKNKEESNNTAYNSAGANFDLTALQEKKEIIVFTPKNEVEVQELVDKLKNGEDVTVDLQFLQEKELIRALDFMSGAIYVLNGKIKKVGNKTYFFCQKLN